MARYGRLQAFQRLLKSNSNCDVHQQQCRMNSNISRRSSLVLMLGGGTSLSLTNNSASLSPVDFVGHSIRYLHCLSSPAFASGTDRRTHRSLSQRRHYCADRSGDGRTGNGTPPSSKTRGNNNGKKTTSEASKNGNGDVSSSADGDSGAGPKGPNSEALSSIAYSTDKKPMCKGCGYPCSPSGDFAGNTRYVRCEHCDRLFVDLQHDKRNSANAKDSSTHEETRPPPNPRKIKLYFDQFIIGQDVAKKSLAVAIYKHYKRISILINQYGNSAAVENQSRRAMDGSSSGDSNLMDQRRGTFTNDIVNGGIGGGGHSLQISHFAADDGKRHGGNNIQSKQAKATSYIEEVLSGERNFVKLEKSNILMLGPTGVGKTYMAKLVAECLDVPFAMQDCTTLTSAGYVGDDVDVVIGKLLHAAGGNIEKAQRGVVFLDEIDKLRASVSAMAGGNYKDVNGESVQQALLKLVEGTVVNVTLQRGAGGNKQTVPVDTTDILFIASGAFNGIERIVANREANKTCGFGISADGFVATKKAFIDPNAAMSPISKSETPEEEIRKKDTLLLTVDSQDVVKFGMIPEFVGRFPSLVSFQNLDEEMLFQILTVAQNSLVAQYKKDFEIDGIDIHFTDGALREVARRALRTKTGARALRGIMERALRDISYEVPDSEISEVTISEETIISGRYDFVVRGAGATVSAATA